MVWCDITELSQYVLQEYLDAVDDKNPGSVLGHIERVSAEIDEALGQGGFAIPESPVSATLTRICAVMAGWRSIGEITSLMDSEASSGNEWLPLQRLNTRSEKDLEQIRAGKLDPFPGADDGPGITVVTQAKIFGADLWETF